MSKKITINGKTYIEDEGAAPETTEEEVKEEGVSEEVIDETAQKILKSLGIDELRKSIAELKQATSKDNGIDAKTASLIDLAGLMKKDVNQLTVQEKIIGFFQAMVQNNQTVMKALSEG